MSGSIVASLGVGGCVVGRFVNHAVIVVRVPMLMISVNHVLGDRVVVSFLHQLLVGNFVVHLMNHFMVHNWFVVERHLSMFSDCMLLDGFFDNFLNIAHMLRLCVLGVLILVGGQISVRVLPVNHMMGRVVHTAVMRFVSVLLLRQLNLNVNVLHFSSVHSRDVLFLHGFFNNPASVVRSVLVGHLPVRIVNMSCPNWLSMVMFNCWHFHRMVTCGMMLTVVVGVVRCGRVMVHIRVDFFDHMNGLLQFLVVLNQDGLLDHLMMHNWLMLDMGRFNVVRLLVDINNALFVMSVVMSWLLLHRLCVLVSMHMVHVLLDHCVIMIVAVLLFPILQRRLLVSLQETLQVCMPINLTLVVRVVVRQVNRLVNGVLDPRVRRHVVLVVVMMVQLVMRIMVHDGNWSFVVFDMRVDHIRVLFWLVVSI